MHCSHEEDEWMITIRVAKDDVYVGSYTLTEWLGSMSAPTPTIECDVIDIDTGNIIDTVTCTITDASLKIVSYTIDETVTGVQRMCKLLFRVTSPTARMTLPSAGEQGFWVY
jgi:hypothetical protein